MNERKAQETIRGAVRDSLAWLDGLPSVENEILEKTEKEERILMTAISPAARLPGSRRWKPVLAFCAAAVLFAGVWAVFRNGSLFNRINSPDVVSEPAVSESVIASPDPESLPSMAVEAENAGMTLLVYEDGKGTVTRGGQVLQEFSVP